MNERIKYIRTSNSLTQQEMAERLGTPRSNIAGYENGARKPSDAVLSLICREFGINEIWLRTGKGEMFKPVDRDKEIEAFVDDVMQSESDDFRRRLLAVLSKLDVSEWELLEKMALKLSADAKAERPLQTPTRPHIIKIAGRDGSYEERALTDEDFVQLKADIEALPPVPEDL